MKLRFFMFLFVLFFIAGCDKKDDDLSPVDKGQNQLYVNLDEKHQSMFGFGGALTWYSDRIVSSPNSEEIYRLIFEDLGLDILRLMNWYYPLDYPNNKSPESMVSLPYDSDYKTMFEANHLFYEKAKSYNPDIITLLSSWGPPSALKSNDNLREGTLKKNSFGEFVYDEFAEYWNDVLDHIRFHPDFISIQNEPGYTNEDWITCKWAPYETGELPSYTEAFDRVYAKIKDRPDAPVMIGPEAENLNAFNGFADALREKEYCPVYAFHPYNFNENSSMESISAGLEDLHKNFEEKPNMMTEFSGLSWMNTARFIHRSLVDAQTSGYIYWELVWESENQSLISINQAGEYTITPLYYVFKHFSKYVSKDYWRVHVDPRIAYVEASGFVSPDGKRATVILINPQSIDLDYEIVLERGNISKVEGFQSKEGEFFQSMNDLGDGSFVPVAGNSITTLNIHLN